MHLLEVTQRGDRLGVVLILVLGQPDFKLGVFGVGAERVLINQLLEVDRRTLVVVLGKGLLSQRVIVLAGGSLLMHGTGRRAERETSRQHENQTPHDTKLGVRLDAARCQGKHDPIRMTTAGGRNQERPPTRAKEAENTALPWARYFIPNPDPRAPGAAASIRQNPAPASIANISAA